MRTSSFKQIMLSVSLLMSFIVFLSMPAGVVMAGFGTPKVLSGTPNLGMRDITFYGNYGICRSAAGIVILKMHTGDSSEFVTEVALGSPLTYPPGGHFRPRVRGSLVYVPDWDEGLWIVDLTNPEVPVVVDGEPIVIPGYCRGIAFYGDYGYVTNSARMYGLITLNVSDPRHPFIANIHPVVFSGFDIEAKYGQAYVAGYHVYTYSLSPPDAPVLLEENSSTGRAFGIRAESNFLLVADLASPSGVAGALAVFSRSDSAAPVFLGREESLDEHLDADVSALGSRAIVLTEQGLLHIVDITDPVSPVRLYSYDTPTPCGEGMTLNGEYLYIVGQTAGVLAYHLANRGDANADGAYSAADVIWLVNYIFRSGPPPTPLEQGDCNCDSEFTSSDLIYLVNFIFKGGPPPFC